MFIVIFENVGVWQIIYHHTNWGKGSYEKCGDMKYSKIDHCKDKGNNNTNVWTTNIMSSM